jgi:hypothetical protein
VKEKQTKKKLLRADRSFGYRVKLFFVPHQDNQYRPHLIRRYGLIAVLFLVLAIPTGYNLSTTGLVLGEKTTITAQSLLESTNRERVKLGVASLKEDDKLSKAAQLKADDMFTQQYWAHIAPDGTTPWKWFESAGYNYSYAGENLAKDFNTADAIVTAWMSSKDHRANVVGSQYTQAGFAVVEGTLGGRSTTLVVALYGAPVSGDEGLAAYGQGVNGASTDKSIDVITRVGMAVQSLTPVWVGSIVLLFVAAIVALGAHAYRDKLPKPLRNTWYRHHGIIKVGGMLSICAIFVFLHSGGQI